MALLSLFLKNVHENVHVLGIKSSFSEPKIYTGCIDPKQWSKLSKKEQVEALKKDWYVYWSFRDPVTGKLKCQPNIKAGANRYSTKRERYAHLKTLLLSLQFLLEQGFSPYADNSQLAALLSLDNISEQQNAPVAHDFTSSGKTELLATNTYSIPQNVAVPDPILLGWALEEALSFKKNTLSPTSFSRFKSRVQQFLEWAHNNYGKQTTVSQLDKKLVMGY